MSQKPIKKLAVVLFNLGGPDSPEAVRPFLFNLFNDSAIIRLPKPFRWLIASIISTSRAPKSRKLYELVGGKSTLLPATEQQANALKVNIHNLAEHIEVFICMRYWDPMVPEVVGKIKSFAPDRIALLPLYPQFSTCTTGTSIKAFEREMQRQEVNIPRDTLCCYPTHSGFLDATIANIKSELVKARQFGSPRVLLSAHGLPQKIIDSGDPYQWQVEQTSMAIVDALDDPDIDCVTCYQSRVTPVKWIGPYTENEVRRAGQDKVPIIIVPIAFVSEHVETLVELDIEFKQIADEQQVPFFSRVPAVAADCKFINGLGDLVRQTLSARDEIISDMGHRRCPVKYTNCPNKVGANEDLRR
jgi:ferrochelatase